MPESNDSPREDSAIPFREELESRFGAKVITYCDRESGQELPGGMCGCCGGGPNVRPDYRGEPWYIFKAGICDSDGVFFSMLCEGCLEDIRQENARRPQTVRDEMAEQITELLGDDVDGMQTMMDEIEP